MDDWLPPLPDETARVLTRADATRLGYSANSIEHRLRTGQWRRVLPRTFLTSDTFTWLDRCRAALAFAGPGALLSGAAALTDTGLKSVPRPARLLVLVPADRWVRSTDWVRIRRTSRRPDRALQPGPACVPVARAVADLALEWRRVDDVRALVAEVVRRKRCTVDELLAELAAGPRNGSAHLRIAIEMSPAVPGRHPRRGPRDCCEPPAFRRSSRTLGSIFRTAGGVTSTSCGPHFALCSKSTASNTTRTRRTPTPPMKGTSFSNRSATASCTAGRT
jgi:hypothetical protein